MKGFLLLLFSVFISLNGFTQVGIGTTTPDDSSILDITATDKGILVPRVSLGNVTTTMLDGVNTASNGLLIYNTNAAVTGGSGVGYYYFNGTTWERLSTSIDASNKWSLTGDAGTSVGTNFLGTTDNIDLSIRTNNVERLRITTQGKLGIYNTGRSVFIGELAGANDNLTNNNNVAIGYNAFNAAVNATNNVAIGYNSQALNTSGTGNVAIGINTLTSLTTGNYNTAMAIDALRLTTTGDYNLGLGSAALYDNTTGSNNIGLGTAALGDNTTGNNNTGLGFQALRENTTGIGSVAVGYQALYNSNADYSNAVGYQALFSNATGTDNLAMGYFALRQNISGSENTAIGNSSLYSNTTSNGNTAVGYLSLTSNTLGYDNTALGRYALSSTNTGFVNTGVGAYALSANTTGIGNTALGGSALGSITTGNSNVGLGFGALGSNSLGSNNVAIGFEALFSSLNAQSVAIGSQSLRNNSGTSNTAIGTNTGFNNTGSGNIFIGHQAGYNETGSNKLYIENSNLNSNNALIYGEFDNNLVRMNGVLEMGQVGNAGYLEIENMGSSNMGIDGDIVPYAGSIAGFDLGNNTATEHWDDVVANGYITYSDRNTKDEIKPLSYGLNEVLKLNPVTYRYKSFISPNNRIRMGLIAQEVEEIIPEVVITEDIDLDENGKKVVSKGEFKAMSYMDLIPVLIKSIQEQNVKIEQLEKEVETLKKRD